MPFDRQATEKSSSESSESEETVQNRKLRFSDEVRVREFTRNEGEFLEPEPFVALIPETEVEEGWEVLLEDIPDDLDDVDGNSAGREEEHDYGLLPLDALKNVNVHSDDRTPSGTPSGDNPEQADLLENVEFDAFDIDDEFGIDYDGSLNSDKAKRGVPGDAYYYPAFSGLARNGAAALRPLFMEPVEILANYTRVKNLKGTIVAAGNCLVKTSLTVKSRHPELTPVTLMAMHAEETLRAVAKLDKSLPERKRYYARLRILSFMRCVFDTLCLAYQEIIRTDVNVTYLDAFQLRQVRRIKNELILHPAQTAKNIKSFAGQCRMWWFDHSFPSIYSNLLGRTPRKRHGLIFSYMSRALPPPPKQPRLMDELVDRLTKTVPPPEVEGWKPWLRDYFAVRFPKKTTELKLWTQPSSHSGFGYPRKVGGHSQAVMDLVIVGMAIRQSSKPSINKFLLEIYASPFAQSWVSRDKDYLIVHKSLSGKKDLASLYEQASVQSFLRECLVLATLYCLDKIDYVPVLPIYAEEKGLKVRYPTCTLTAANLVYQVLRRIAEQHMVLDPRMSEGLGGSIRANLDPEGPFYSQDMTLATDLHPFWFTGGIYEVLAELHNPVLGKYEKYYKKLFGPKKLVSEQIFAPEAFSVPWLPGWMVGIEKELPMPSKPTVVPEKIIEPFLTGIKERTDYRRDAPPPKKVATSSSGSRKRVRGVRPEKFHTRTTKGPGVTKTTAGVTLSTRIPSHFDNEELASAIKFTEQCAKYLDQYIAWIDEINGVAGVLTTTGAMMGDATSFPGLSLMSAFNVERKVKELFPDLLSHFMKDGKLCGDDSLFSKFLKALQGPYEEGMAETGGVISQTKTAHHQTKGIFCEVPYVNGKPIPYSLLSEYAAPPGGSKGTVSYYAQPRVIVQHQHSIGRSPRKTILRFSPHRQAHRALYQLGVPVGADEALGGLSHPNMPAVSTKYHKRWLTKVSQLKLIEIMTGTGLNPIRPGASQFLRTAAKDWVRETISLAREGTRVNELLRNNDKYLIDDFYRPELSDEPMLVVDPEDETGKIPLIDLMDSQLAPILSWEFYLRRVPPDMKVPSLKMTSEKFRRKVFESKRITGASRFTYSGTYRDYQRKKNTFVENPASLRIKTNEVRSYGLEPSKGVGVGRDQLFAPMTRASSWLTHRPGEYQFNAALAKEIESFVHSTYSENLLPNW
jgi:hypothetical protein